MERGPVDWSLSMVFPQKTKKAGRGVQMGVKRILIQCGEAKWDIAAESNCIRVLSDPTTLHRQWPNDCMIQELDRVPTISERFPFPELENLNKVGQKYAAKSFFPNSIDSGTSDRSSGAFRSETDGQ